MITFKEFFEKFIFEKNKYMDYKLKSQEHFEEINQYAMKELKNKVQLLRRPKRDGIYVEFRFSFSIDNEQADNIIIHLRDKFDF